MRVVCLLMSLVICRPVMAQSSEVVVGDSLRVRAGKDAMEHRGRLLSWTSEQLVLRQFGVDRPFVSADLVRVDRWRRTNPVLPIVGMGAAAAAGSLTVSAISDNEPITGSEAADAAIFAAGGMIIGTIIYLAAPGSWKTILKR